jgi:hypothetical protein
MDTAVEVIRGGHAREVLDSDIFREASNAVKSAIDAHMLKVPVADQAMHTRLILMRQCWHQLESYLEQVKQTGEVADFQIQQEAERKKWRMFG